MLGRSKKATVKEKIASAYALALQLAQDKKFRDRLLSAIEHGYAAGQRTRRGVGWRGTVAGLAADETLLRELRSARRISSRLMDASKRSDAPTSCETSSCWLRSPLWRLCRNLEPASVLPLQRRRRFVSARPRSETPLHARLPTAPAHVHAGSRT